MRDSGSRDDGRPGPAVWDRLERRAVRALGPHGDDQGQWTVVRRRLAARSSANRPSCQGVR